ncbi:MAG TPA: DNA repair protein RecN, partial [Methylothermaceae bacterium]|nr:DNA repair protein RecN [Methylothermaceae bacterium]
MLTALTIRDLAVVRHLDLEFDHGFTALTGETGAGKSILLTALGLALGERADSDWVRSGSERAEVIMEFSLDQAPEARRWLRENDLETGDSCLIRRSIAAKGRSRTFVNDRPVSLQALQNLGRHLLEIHGQHAHLRLRHPAEQRQLLDLHGGHQELVHQVADLARQWRETRAELQDLRQQNVDQSLREEFLRFQIQELEETGIENLDYDALEEEFTQLANLDRILAATQQQLQTLFDSETAVIDRVDHAIRELEAVCRWAPRLQEVVDLLSSARIQLEEAGYGLRQQLDSLEADPGRMAQLDQLFTRLHDLARKHQVPPPELPRRLDQLRQELAGLADREQHIADLESRLQQLERRYREAATRLSRQRRENAGQLGNRITTLMQELGMPHGEFRIVVETEPDADPRPEGLDRIEFMVTTNLGLPARPLAKVASGGELSRLSLAVQVACSENRPVPTLVFDEVDTGIGGGVAEIVGRCLRELGGDRQVLCVTHLPQVAAQAHHHYLVEKHTTAQGSETRVVPLQARDRHREIARMLG